MTMIRSKFSNSTYRDFVECNPVHFNSMRANPTLPQAIIENNIVQLRPAAISAYWSNRRLTRRAQQLDEHRPKRCLFTNDQVHLASLSSLTNLHLVESQLADDDFLRREIGTKRRVVDLRNGMEFKTLGDKSYRDVEYSSEFFNFSSKEWRSQIELKQKETATKDTPTLKL